MIEIRDRNFEVDTVIEKVRSKSVGAIVTFIGTVRDNSKGRLVEHIEIQVYEEMALKQLENIKMEAIEKFEIKDVAIVHRYGDLKVSDNIMMIAVAAEHRQEAFEACRYIIDKIKENVPIWKKEYTPDGTFWVEGKKN